MKWGFLCGVLLLGIISCSTKKQVLTAFVLDQYEAREVALGMRKTFDAQGCKQWYIGLRPATEHENARLIGVCLED